MLNDFQRLILDAPPEDVARLFYGPTWPEAIRQAGAEAPDYIARRAPLGGDIADALRPHLKGRLAHDGRSTGERRTSGWWVADPSTGSWSPAQVADFGRLLKAEIDSAIDATTARLASASDAIECAQTMRDQWARSGGTRADTPLTAKAFEEVRRYERDRASAMQTARGERLRRAVLSGVRLAAASTGRHLESALQNLRPSATDRSLALSDTAVRVIAATWVSDLLDVGELMPDGNGRVAVADVRAAYDNGPEFLPLKTLFAALDHPTVLGARLRRVQWAIPEEFEALSEGPEAAESATPNTERSHESEEGAR